MKTFLFPKDCKRHFQQCIFQFTPRILPEHSKNVLAIFFMIMIDNTYFASIKQNSAAQETYTFILELWNIPSSSPPTYSLFQLSKSITTFLNSMYDFTVKSTRAIDCTSKIHKHFSRCWTLSISVDIWRVIMLFIITVFLRRIVNHKEVQVLANLSMRFCISSSMSELQIDICQRIKDP